GFAFFDRQLRAVIYGNEQDLLSKWRDFYSIADAEHFVAGDVAYADLRFDGRVVVKPLRAMPAASTLRRPVVPVQITNEEECHSERNEETVCVGGTRNEILVPPAHTGPSLTLGMTGRARCRR